MEQSEINRMMEGAAKHIMKSETQSPSQKREQMYALQIAAIQLGCDDVIRPIYEQAIVDDGLMVWR